MRVTVWDLGTGTTVSTRVDRKKSQCWVLLTDEYAVVYMKKKPQIIHLLAEIWDKIHALDMLWWHINILISLMYVDKQASTKHHMHLFYHHIFSVTDCGVVLITFTAAKIEKTHGWCHKNLFCVLAAIPASLLLFNMEKNEYKPQQQMPPMLQTGSLTPHKLLSWSSRSIHYKLQTSNSKMNICWHTKILIRAMHPKTGQMFTLKKQVIKFELYCVQVKVENLERQT